MVKCETCPNEAAVCTACKSDNPDLMLVQGGICRETCTTAASKKVKIEAAETYSCIDVVDTGCLVAIHSSPDTDGIEACAEGFCAEGYVFDDSQCQPCPTGCRTCKWSGGAATCLFTGCQDGYGRKSNGDCSRCPVGCTQCSWDSTASALTCDTDKCASDYKVVQANKCAKCPIGCNQCTVNNMNEMKCSSGQCGNTYVQISETTQCFPCSQWCDKCSYYTTHPATSNEGTSMTRCNSNQCRSEYAMRSSDYSCKACPSSCDVCTYSTTNADTVCNVEKCASGTAQNPNNFECKNCPGGCSVCIYDALAENEVRCLKGGCNSFTLETEVNGVVTCTDCTADCKHCMANGFDTICLDMQCEQRFGLTSGYNCEACSEGCLECDIATDGTHTCVTCDSGFVMFEGACQACPGDCHSCSFDSVNQFSICSSGACNTGFAQNSETDNDGCEACPDKCRQCTYDTTLGGTKCSTDKCDLETGFGFNVDNGQCEACAPYCITCMTNGAGKCDTCESGYKLNSEKLCESCSSSCYKCNSAGAAKCDSNSCYDRYTLNKDSKVCESCADNCKKCSSNGATKCDKNQCDVYYAWDETSMLCLKCPDNCNECTVNAEGATECVDKECFAYYGRKDSDKKCHECPNECITCVDTMDENGGFTGQLKCTACNERFILNEEICGSCPMNCAECSEVSAFGLECSKCKVEFAIDTDKECRACPDACSECTYDSASDKTMCKPGMCYEKYALAEDGSCKRCSDLAYANCQSCTDITGNSTSVSMCMECSEGYTKRDDGLACIACAKDAYCSHCEDPVGNQCEACSSGYEISLDKTICGIKCHQCDPEDTNCETFDSNSKYGSQVCNSCWVKSREDMTTNNKQYWRGCSANYTCTQAYKDSDCQNANDIEECNRCCDSANCNTFDSKAGAKHVQASIAIILMVAVLQHLI